MSETPNLTPYAERVAQAIVEAADRLRLVPNDEFSDGIIVQLFEDLEKIVEPILDEKGAADGA